MDEPYPVFLRDRPVAREAAQWAGDRHREQRREVDCAPFILHPLEVAALLSGRGYDDTVVAAALLHDVVERTDASIAAIRACFGERVGELVAALTEDPSIEDHDARKAALRAQVAAADPDARAIYAADKIAKSRELRAHAARTPGALGDPALRRRLEHYRESLLMLKAVLGDLPFVQQLAFEIWALDHLPPSGG